MVAWRGGNETGPVKVVMAHSQRKDHSKKRQRGEDDRKKAEVAYPLLRPFVTAGVISWSLRLWKVADLKLLC